MVIFLPEKELINFVKISKRVAETENMASKGSVKKTQP